MINWKKKYSHLINTFRGRPYSQVVIKQKIIVLEYEYNLMHAQNIRNLEVKKFFFLDFTMQIMKIRGSNLYICAAP